jgi:acyl-CoA reductase-like NAD-dependent aldehyde dehydrogenase
MKVLAACEMFVDGAWGPSTSGATFTAESPATGEAIGEVPRGTREDARRATPMESFTELQAVVLS